MKIAVDFDRTICNSGQNGDDLPIAGARDALSRLHELGHTIIIHSCNSPDYIEKWMRNNDCWFDSIWARVGKPAADCYLDDKGLKFISWPQVFVDLKLDNQPIP